jgi:hypothetical protein
MTADNISEFKLQVLRAVTTLYSAHPKSISLSAVDLLVPPPQRNDADAADRMESAAGTILWLYRNEYVLGEFHGNSNNAFVSSAQLSPGSYSILRAVDQNAGRVLGDAIVDAISEKNERDLSVLAERLDVLFSRR